MALIKLEKFYPNYRQQVLGGKDIKGIDVFAGKTEEKIGTVCDDVVDLTGRFRYLVIDTSSWGIDKKVLLPVGSCRLDFRARRVYADALVSKKQVEKLPEYADGITVDYDCEEWGKLASPTPDENPEPVVLSPTVTDELDDSQPQTVTLYEERAIANKSRCQTSEVAIAKRIETETRRISIPIQKERIVIERSVPADANIVVSEGEAILGSGEVARIKIYQETVDIHKAIFVRELVTIKKEVEPDTVDAEVTLRREELEINTEGKAVVGTGY